jgi:hypothetical protein
VFGVEEMSFIETLINGFMHLNGVYLTAIAGALIGFPLIQVGNKWGKVFGDNKFKSPKVVFIGFLASLFFVGVFLDVAQPTLIKFLFQFLNWLPIFDAVATLTAYAYFCKSFEFSFKWQIILPLVLVILANIGYLYVIGTFQGIT